jgi:two-component system nitrate/nitrite response regulator NarL
MSNTADRSRRSCPRVLMVDDDLALLEAMTEWLEERCRAEVTVFDSAEKVMAEIRPGSFDVCILDYRLDGANGLTLGAMLREINPGARFILLSGELSSNIESLAFELGFGRVFSKPVSPELLAQAIIH